MSIAASDSIHLNLLHVIINYKKVVHLLTCKLINVMYLRSLRSDFCWPSYPNMLQTALRINRSSWIMDLLVLCENEIFLLNI